MHRLNILIWHIHGSYLNTLSRIDHTWYVPTKPDKPEGYGGRGPTFDLPPNVVEVPAEQVRDLALDLVIYQTPKNYCQDRYEILSREQQQLPAIYLEHNTPRPDPVATRHVVDDPRVLLVHVTHYNRLMWDCGQIPTRVIEHAVAIDPTARYTGEIAAGITIVNGIQRRPRIAGLDILDAVRQKLPIELAGMMTEELGGLGDIPYRELHGQMSRYRLLFSPIRYTSLPLAVIEGMTLGMPVVALATTELPSAIRNGESGFVSNDIGALMESMRALLRDRELARRVGDHAREVAMERFGLDRFARDWNQAFAEVTGVPAATMRSAPLRREGGTWQ